MTGYTPPLKKTYIFNNEPIDFEQIPEGASYQCLHITEEEEEVAYIELFEAGSLAAIESPYLGEDLSQFAQNLAQLAHNNGTEIDPFDGIAVNLYLPPEEFPNPGFVLDDEESCGFKARFMARIIHTDEPTIEVEANSPNLFVAEVFVMQPTGLVSKRALYTESKELLAIEYPFYRLNSSNQLDEHICFVEASPIGEQFILSDLDEYSRESLETGALYVLPVNQDEQLELVHPYIHKQFVAILDLSGQPIPEEELAQHQDFYRVSFTEDEKIQCSDFIVDNHIAQSEIFEVPLELHWYVYHAYLRQLQQEKSLISTDGLKATQYIHIHAPISHEPIEGVPLEEGQYRLHRTTFHLNGNLIVHECTVYSAEGEALKTYSMHSPTNLKVWNENDLTAK